MAKPALQTPQPCAPPIGHRLFARIAHLHEIHGSAPRREQCRSSSQRSRTGFSAPTWSPEPTKDALIDRDDWKRIHAITTTQGRAARPSDVTYLLRGHVFCATCERRKTGEHQAHRPRCYRCELRRARPGLTTDDHPADVYAREDTLVQANADWLAELFAPQRTQQTQLLVAADTNTDYDAGPQGARERLHDARQRLAQYRRARDGGGDATTVTGGITEAAEQELRQSPQP